MSAPALTHGFSLPALTMTEPWATLVAKSVKRRETRSWHTRYRGPIAIQSAKGFPAHARATCLSEPFRSALADVGYAIDRMPVEDWKTFTLPLGHVIAIAQLVTVELITEFNVPPDPERAFGNYTAGRFMWLFGKVVELSRPIPASGAHRLWPWQLPMENQDEIVALLGQMHTASEQMEPGGQLDDEIG